MTVRVVQWTTGNVAKRAWEYYAAVAGELPLGANVRG